jgi:hypothetical protein
VTTRVCAELTCDACRAQLFLHLERLALDDGPIHGRLGTGRPDDGKVDVCRCGRLADLCPGLRKLEAGE